MQAQKSVDAPGQTRLNLIRERAVICRKLRLAQKARSAFTQEQLDEFREMLETEKTILSEETKTLSVRFKHEICCELETSRTANHIADTNLQSSFVSESLAQNRTKRIQKINEALKRLDDDIYGVCQDCEDPINIRRLLAWPATRFCTSCKESRNGLKSRINGNGNGYRYPIINKIEVPR